MLAAGVALPCLAADAAKYIAPVRTFAGQALKHGKDVYGPQHTPLFVDGLNVDTLEPVTWKQRNGREWILSDLGNQQIFFRTLAGLTALTGEPAYKRAAVEATRYALDHLREGGLLMWGGHVTYNASDDVIFAAEDKSKVHELKNHYPFYELFWEVDPAATKDLIEEMWNGHILNWGNLDFNRHATHQPRGALWKNEYRGGPVFFWGQGLTFINAGSDLYFAAAMLSKFTGDPAPLVWSKRLAKRYVETRNPKTGIGGYQFSQTNAWCDSVGKILGDRAIYQYGDDFKGRHVVEGTLFPCYGNTPEIHPRVCQFYLGEMLGEQGKEFTQWSLEELTAWGKSAYRESDHSFIPMLTDGTSMEGHVAKKEGYFGPQGKVMKAGRAGPRDFWTYALAARMTGDGFMWRMTRSIAQGNEFGDIGAKTDARPKLNLATPEAEPTALLGFLELHRKTRRPEFLSMAQRIGDNLLAARYHKNFFTLGKDRLYAKFDRLEPLALLHLAAAMLGKPGLVPIYNGGSGFFAAAYGDRDSVYDSWLYTRLRTAP
jgi:pectate lyase